MWSRKLLRGWQLGNLRLTTCVEHVPGLVMKQAGNWSKSNSYSDMFQSKRPRDTADANDEFAELSTIGLGLTPDIRRFLRALNAKPATTVSWAPEAPSQGPPRAT
jgi:hypothetical protein